MAPVMIVQGDLTQTQPFLQQLLIADLPVDCVIIPTVPEENRVYQSLIVASALCAQLTLRVGTAVDYARAQWLVLFDTTTSGSPLPKRVSELRRLVNYVLESGFQGQWVFAGSDDDVLTYFTWKFSGATATSIWGLGTAPLEQLLVNRLAERLGVAVSAIRTTVVGPAETPVIAWSRTYVGPVPILMYLANADDRLDADDLTKMATWLEREATESLTLLRSLTLIRLLTRLTAHQAPVVPVTHPQPMTAYLATATPVVVTPTGIRTLTTLSLAEDEQRAYTYRVNDRQLIIQQLAESRMEEPG